MPRVSKCSPDSPENTSEGLGDERDVVFRSPREKGRQVPGSSWRVVRDTCRDAASVFDRLFNQVASATEVLGACLVALHPLKLIARMYRIERLACERVVGR